MANRRWRPDLNVTQRPLPRLALSTPSAVPARKTRHCPRPSLTQTSYPSLPKDEKCYRCVYVLATLRISNRIESGSGSRRKLKVAPRGFSHNGQNASDAGGPRDVLQTSGGLHMRLILYGVALARGRNSGAAAACLRSGRAIRVRLRRTTTTDPRGTPSFAEAPFSLSATYSVHLEFWRVLNHDRPRFRAVATRSFPDLDTADGHRPVLRP